MRSVYSATCWSDSIFLGITTSYGEDFFYFVYRTPRIPKQPAANADSSLILTFPVFMGVFLLFFFI